MRSPAPPHSVRTEFTSRPSTSRGNTALLITNGGPSNLNRDTLAAQNPVAHLFGRVLNIKRHGRIVSLVGVWDFERDENPDGGEVDSNPVDVLADRGHLVIADAGGNTRLKARAHGAVEVLSLFPNRCLAGVPEPCAAEDTFQAVPDRRGKRSRRRPLHEPADRLPVPGRCRERVPRGPPRRARRNRSLSFTNIMDLAFDKHGTLTHPGGITVGKGGALYVTNNADVAGEGEVLRIDADEDGKKDGEEDDGEDDDGADDGDDDDEDT